MRLNEIIVVFSKKGSICDGHHNNYRVVWQYTSHFCKKAFSSQAALFASLNGRILV
jgi:hypothetical protein